MGLSYEELQEILEKWQNQKGISRNQALKVLECAVELFTRVKELEGQLFSQEVQSREEVLKVEENAALCVEKNKRKMIDPRGVKKIMSKNEKMTFRVEYRKNGYNNKLYGPYLVGYWREGRRLRNRYFGRVAPNFVL